MSAPRFSFPAPTTGDELLGRATVLELSFCRWPAGDEPAEVHYRLSGDLRLDSHAATMLVGNLLAEFQSPRAPRQEGGAAC